VKTHELGKALGAIEGLHRKLGDTATADGLQQFANLLTSKPDQTVASLAKSLRDISGSRRAGKAGAPGRRR
jgi:hypothetical protein